MVNETARSNHGPRRISYGTPVYINKPAVSGTGNKQEQFGSVTGKELGQPVTKIKLEVSGFENKQEQSGTRSKLEASGTANKRELSGAKNYSEVSGIGKKIEQSGTRNKPEASGTGNMQERSSTENELEALRAGDKQEAFGSGNKLKDCQQNLTEESQMAVKKYIEEIVNQNSERVQKGATLRPSVQVTIVKFFYNLQFYFVELGSKSTKLLYSNT